VLKREAASNLDNVTFEDETSISGVIEWRGFIPDHLDRFFGLISDVWSANVTYEFKEGRYKVSLSNIVCTSTTTKTNTYFSTYPSIGFSSGSAVSVHHANDVYSLASLMYVDESLRGSEELWIRVANFYDRNFTAAVILPLREEENEKDNDW
jgi:hypothetical protein